MEQCVFDVLAGGREGILEQGGLGRDPALAGGMAWKQGERWKTWQALPAVPVGRLAGTAPQAVMTAVSGWGCGKWPLPLDAEIVSW
jgi:hypothetical protein